MADFKTYDPSQITVSFNGILVQGFADVMVTAERNTDSFTVSPGSQGDVTRVRSRDKTGQVTITLQAESPSNDLLSTVLQDDENDGSGVGALLITNLNGTTELEATNAWLMKFPATEYGNEAGTREWIIECAELEMFVGGNTV